MRIAVKNGGFLPLVSFVSLGASHPLGNPFLGKATLWMFKFPLNAHSSVIQHASLSPHCFEAREASRQAFAIWQRQLPLHEMLPFVSHNYEDTSCWLHIWQETVQPFSFNFIDSRDTWSFLINRENKRKPEKINVLYLYKMLLLKLQKINDYGRRE